MNPLVMHRLCRRVAPLATIGLALLCASSPATAEAPPDHYVIDDDVVTDTGTSLMWQRRVVWGEYFNRVAANDYCDRLTLAGYTDWRLPTVYELITIVDPTQANPTIDPIAFPDTPSFDFWTSTRYVTNDAAGWVIYFQTGHLGYTGLLAGLQVRCVR